MFANRRSALVLVVILAAMFSVSLSVWPERAEAESIIRMPFSGGRRPFQLDVHAGFSGLGVGLASGVRFGIPIVQNGFVRSINNAVYLNFGADFYFVRFGHDYGPGLGFPVTLHWEFYFTERWSAFGELGANIFIHPSVFRGDGWGWSPGHWIVGAVGGHFFINDVFALTLRLGSPYSAFGVTFLF